MMKKRYYLRHPSGFLKVLGRFVSSKFKTPVDEETTIQFDNQLLIGNPSRGSVNRRIWKLGMTEFLPTETVKHRLNNDMTFVDIGANHGYFTFLAAKRAKRVIAFEPVPSAYDKMEKGIAVNEYTNIELYPIALGSENGEISMDIEAFQSNAKSESGLKVPLRKLDDLSNEREFDSMDFIKIDIEGDEFNALLGMEGILSRDKPFLMVEVHPKFMADRGQSVEQLADYLAKLGYKLRPLDVSSEEYSAIMEGRNDKTFHLIAE